MDPSAILDHLRAAAAAVPAALEHVDDWGIVASGGAHAGQHHSDVAADRAVLDVLLPAGFAVLSEETGLHRGGDVTVVVDPVDGSTNAWRGIPHWATSLAALDGDGLVAALVVDQATGEQFHAVRGGGAFLDGRPIRPTSAASLGESIVGVSGYTDGHLHLGSRQYRALGAGALDLCYVAAGRLDGYLDLTEGQHGPWDYLAALLVCHEAGAVTAEVEGRPLVVLDHTVRRGPVAAATATLLDELVAARAAAAGGGLPRTSNQ